MAMNAPLLERHLPRADELSSPQARAQLLYVRCRIQRKAGCADLDPDIEALANSLAREAADRESFLLALHAISLVPYRHEGLLCRGVEGEDCEGDRGWTAGSYLRYIADCFRLSCPVTSTTSIVSNAITYESFFLYGLRFMGWDLSRARVPNLGEAISTVNSRVLPAESAAMLLAAFQMSYWSSSKRLRNLANISLESLRKLQHCTQFEVNETAPHARYQVEVDEVLRAVSSSDFRVLREVEVDPYSLDLLLITPQFLRTMQADVSVNL
ncbi:hypothetical protein Pmar_PMAR027679 [Perkinsus marinus ATCC 50983]|uniref:Uncharacterized protein n=1 Tax=Perkinsus marinus (strain ATCC 50983 / TXsc) TaxID=423536 RepID=C5KSJ0_PERM5|nr:hypothetical protein Pmar_PMAR027679 [Perkinsus marinus ATCC 50983]EER12539.1 hypothetical protein Pmar_PMAR027679 [Perkinsus marinus ATCC 50983]|eukprot:XP_002780744.1 hypothetical protein Pmar_PMAR027679 [Perkinsus marinus ATCC 50983]